MHALEVRGDLATFAASRKPAWHALGTTVPHDMGVEEALTLSHLADWDLQKLPVYAVLPDGGWVGVPDKVAVTRRNPFQPDQRDVLGVTGPDYSLVSNEVGAAYMQAILDTDEVVVDALGSIHDGKQVFVTMRRPEDVLIPGTDDRIRNFLIGTWRHDGGGSVQVFPSDVRVVCSNTLGMAQGERGLHTYSVRHVGTAVQGKVQAAREALKVTWKATEDLVALAAEWAATDLTRQQFDAIVQGVFPLADAAPKATVTRTRAKRDLYRDLYENAPTQENIRGSAWAAAMAWTEYTDWASTPDTDAEREALSLQQATSPALEKYRARGMATIRRVLANA
jgi:phage/plasmid-like protein (TIGR03299 family)